MHNINVKPAMPDDRMDDLLSRRLQHHFKVLNCNIYCNISVIDLCNRFSMRCGGSGASRPRASGRKRLHTIFIPVNLQIVAIPLRENVCLLSAFHQIINFGSSCCFGLLIC